MDQFLALVHPFFSHQGALILRALGDDAQAELKAAIKESRGVEIMAPEGEGLHVWQGSLSAMAGEWRRATAQDLEDFGMPLSEAADLTVEELHQDSEPGYCCVMRKKFVPGIVAEDPSVQLPTEFADHVLDWSKPIVFGLRFCPFCGRKVDHTQTLRVLTQKKDS